MPRSALRSRCTWTDGRGVDAYNYTQPLIRYELSDRMVRLPNAVEHGHPRVLLSGLSGPDAVDLYFCHPMCDAVVRVFFNLSEIKLTEDVGNSGWGPESRGDDATLNCGAATDAALRLAQPEATGG
jgi:hypothetical protein